MSANPRSLTGWLESRRSIVGDEPGITRDRIYGKRSGTAAVLRVVDTGGIVPDDQALIPSRRFFARHALPSK